MKVSACCDLLDESAFCRNCNFTCVQEMMQVLKKNRPKARSAEVARVTETSRTVSSPVTHQAMHTTGHCAQSNICRHKSAYCCALQDTLHKSSILIMLQTVERHWTSNVMESHAFRVFSISLLNLLSRWPTPIDTTECSLDAGCFGVRSCYGCLCFGFHAEPTEYLPSHSG